MEAPAPAPAGEPTNASFRVAFFTAIFMLVLMCAGLGISAVLTAKGVHGITLSTPWDTLWQQYSIYVALLAVSAYTVLAWTFIIIWIHGYWPDGWIYKKRTKNRQVQGEGRNEDAEQGSPEAYVPGDYPMEMSGPAKRAYTVEGDSEQDLEDIVSRYYASDGR